MGNRAWAVEVYNKGVAAANDRTQPAHLQIAYQEFASAVFADPTFGEAWYGLGNANNDQQRPQAAIAAWRRALTCEMPDDVRGRCMVNLGWQLHNTGNIVEAYELLLTATHQYPKLGAGWLNLGIAYGTIGEPSASVSAHRKALALDKDDPTTQFGLAMSLLYDQQYVEGFQHYESRFAYRLHHFLKYPYPKWEGEPGKTVFLVADQGLGDTLSFARFVEEAASRCKYLHVVIQKELMACLAQAWSHIPNINLMPLASPLLPADAWSTFMSLPWALKLTGEEIRTAPQVKIPVFSKPTSWMVPDAKLHIGISWAGSSLNEINKFRSIPMELFLELYRVPGVQLYSLQVDSRSVDLQTAGATALVRDLSQYVDNVLDTVALLRDLDLVITAESALGHICAAAGKEAWIPYSLLGNDFRIGHRGEHLLWTPKHRIFQQGMDQKWEPVFEQIVEALRERVDASRKAAA